MSVIVNKNTTQTPMTAVGNTGSQLIRFIPACRVYIKAADSTTAAPVQAYYTKSNGATPTGWTDLGIMDGPGQVTYTKDRKKVQTGIDQVVRAVYIDQKTAELAVTLDQFDDVVLQNISGLTPSVITNGSVVNFQLGQEDIINKALLLVCQNKLDGKEIQFYHPAADLSFVIDYSNDKMSLKLSADLIAFTASGATVDSMISTTVFA